jgi:hypothetical protein
MRSRAFCWTGVGRAVRVKGCSGGNQGVSGEGGEVVEKGSEAVDRQAVSPAGGTFARRVRLPSTRAAMLITLPPRLVSRRVCNSLTIIPPYFRVGALHSPQGTP